MVNLYSRGIFDWKEIIKTPLSLDIAKIRAPHSSDKFAADQIATSLHEAIHLIYAVWTDIPVIFVAVSPRKKGSIYWKGNRVKGTTLAMDYNFGYPAINSACAAALFELELNNKETNFIVESEINTALEAARSLSWPERNDEITAHSIVIKVLNMQTSYLFSAEKGQLGQLWWLIRSVAIAILISRNKNKGEVSTTNTKSIRRFINRFCKSDKFGEGEYFPEFRLRTSMTQDIFWLYKAINQNNVLTQPNLGLSR
jgi:hypothetical protein